MAAALARLTARAEGAARAAAPSQAAQRRAMVRAGFKPVFGELGEAAEFVSHLAAHLEALRRHGAAHAAQALARGA
jgi:fructuronate reductase